MLDPHISNITMKILSRCDKESLWCDEHFAMYQQQQATITGKTLQKYCISCFTNNKKSSRRTPTVANFLCGYSSSD